MSSGTQALQITPETKVGTLLEAYPQLEDKLIELAPAFAKLRNPILRRTVAKVTSLKQAAKVGGISLGKLINSLRAELGQESLDVDEDSGAAGVPSWFDEGKVIGTLDARPLIEAGDQPMGVVMSELRKLRPGQVYELITPFHPAPLIDAARQKGHDTYSRQDEPEIFRTYFTSKSV